MKVRLVFCRWVSSDLMRPAYRLEWSKSYAWSKRWEEEAELLKEEMRRTLEFLAWKSARWSSKTLKVNPSLSPALSEGLTAYALRQAAVFASLRDHFSSLWRASRRSTPHLTSRRLSLSNSKKLCRVLKVEMLARNESITTVFVLSRLCSRPFVSVISV